MGLQIGKELRNLQRTLLLLSGWGMRSSVWRAVERYWREGPVLMPEPSMLADSAERLDQLRSQANQAEDLTVIGWSLGGMLAMELALAFPGLVKRLGLIGSTCKFAADENYLFGQPVATIRRMKKRLAADPEETLKQFYKSQFSEAEAASGTSGAFLEMAAQWETEDPAELQAGLNYLLEQDLRSRVQGLKIPVRMLHGACDSICPPAAADWLCCRLEDAELTMVPSAGHMPYGFQGGEFFTWLRSACLND